MILFFTATPSWSKGTEPDIFSKRPSSLNVTLEDAIFSFNFPLKEKILFVHFLHKIYQQTQKATLLLHDFPKVLYILLMANYMLLND